MSNRPRTPRGAPFARTALPTTLQRGGNISLTARNVTRKDVQVRRSRRAAAPVWMDRGATTQKACSLIKEAAARGAKVCAFPESFIPAFPYGVWHHGVKRNMHFYRSLTQAAVSLDGPEVGALREAARNAQCVVVMGITEQSGGSLYNSQLSSARTASSLGRDAS